ncbi:MAG: hypothetical protein LBS59_05970 [Puniceicoccales bacterium]|jgi:hypothetical protein|nr:hypothetical protein [Puniceicoccales bacterium]
MKHIVPFLILSCATAAWQGCDQNASQPVPAAKPVTSVPAETPPPAAPSPTAAAPAVPVAPAAVPAPAAVEDAAENFDPATDPVLGWWVGVLDPSDESKVSVLWPSTASDARCLKTIRFLNDSMATNGCCAGAEWSFVAPKFYKVDREIHELYYLADANTLYFLARVAPAGSDGIFKKIVAGIAQGETPDALFAKGVATALGKFRRPGANIGK